MTEIVINQLETKTHEIKILNCFDPSELSENRLLNYEKWPCYFL
jgi:hypothetical protein